jgi:hypothetical protein
MSAGEAASACESMGTIMAWAKEAVEMCGRHGRPMAARGRPSGGWERAMWHQPWAYECHTQELTTWRMDLRSLRGLGLCVPAYDGLLTRRPCDVTHVHVFQVQNNSD